jgi:predicted adenylyl cyclase CyaB
MLEKEIKILEVDVEDLQKKLEALWAEKTFEWYIHDIYYDFPWDTGDKMEANKRLFRVRKKWDIHMYTIKRKRNKVSEWGEEWLKIADEWEREITDVDSFTKVLEKYGMVETREKKKFRISYSLENMEFDIDDYFYGDDRSLIPPLLEIEAHTRKDIYDLIKKLWLEKNRQEKWGSRKLFKHYWVEYKWL